MNADDEARVRAQILTMGWTLSADINLTLLILAVFIPVSGWAVLALTLSTVASAGLALSCKRELNKLDRERTTG